MAGDMFPQTKENMGLRRPRDMENLENIDWPDTRASLRSRIDPAQLGTDPVNNG